MALFRPQRGSLIDSLNEQVEIKSLLELHCAIKEKCYIEPKKGSIKVRYYTYDNRVWGNKSSAHDWI